MQVVLPQFTNFPPNFAFFDADPIVQECRRQFGDRTFADFDIPLYMVAADMTDGSKVVISEGDIVTAIRASIGIPLIFGPIEVDGRWLLDGGIVDPLPIDVAIKEGCDLIIAMGFENLHEPNAHNFAGHIMQIISIMENNLTKAQFAFHNAVHHAEIIPIMVRFEHPIGVFDTHLIPQIIEAGEEETEKHLSYIKQVLEKMT